MPPVPDPVKNILVSNLNQTTRERQVTWDLPDDPTIVGFNVYRSEIQYADFDLLTTTPLAATVNSYTDTDVPFNANMPFQWWWKITALNAQGGESDLSATLPGTDRNIDFFNEPPIDPTIPPTLSEQDRTDPEFGEDCFQTLPPVEVDPRWFLEIRRRHKWLLQVGGAPMVLLKRRWTGTLCPNFDPRRGQHKHLSGNVVDPCFGTNFVGGYHTPLTILVSLVSPSLKSANRREFGMWFEFEPKSWTLWEPNLLDRDVLVRADTGERYEILNVQRTKWRGMVLHQNFDMRLIETTDVIYKVPIS